MRRTEGAVDQCEDADDRVRGGSQTRRGLRAALSLGLLAWIAVGATSAQTYQQEEPFLTLELSLLAKAEPDECYAGVGVPGAPPEGPPCTTGVPKVNQAYVWGLTNARQNLWFGTAPNVHCLVLGGFLAQSTPQETREWVCEFGESALSPPLLPMLGDWRPPRIFRYDLVLGTPEEITPNDPLIENTLGIRSAGSDGTTVILGGPSLTLTGGINLFAFDAFAKNYLGSMNLPEYDNIRKWLLHDGVLYAGVGKSTGGGAVLRWEPGLPQSPFRFQEVGTLGSQGTELAIHDGRLFVTTWPRLGLPTVQSGLWMSPPIPAGGLTPAHAGAWQKVWEAGDYEPDLIIRNTYGGGALASFEGDLYWGTMHVPFLATEAYFLIFGQPTTAVELLEWGFNTQRSISIFRGRDFGTEAQQVELLYGEAELPTFDILAGTWSWVPNAMGATPLYGSAGFGNYFNNYTWTMQVYQNQLFIGTMDFSFLLPGMSETLLGFPIPPILLPQDWLGADLWRFVSGDAPAVLESRSGVGNFSSYGVRTMLSDSRNLYLGMANPMNLLTDPNDNLPQGGWELLRLRPPYPGLDRYKCYRTKETKKRCFGNAAIRCSIDAECPELQRPCLGFPKGVRRHLQDRFEDKDFEVKKPKSFCAPVDQDGGGILDSDIHMKRYGIKAVKGEDRHERQIVLANDPYGTHLLQTVGEDSVLTPTLISLTAGIDPGVPTNYDDYKCYKVKEVRRVCTGDCVTRCVSDTDCLSVGGICHHGFGRGVQTHLKDYFEQKDFHVKKLKLFCAPVDNQGTGVGHPDQDLLGYQVRGVPGGAKHLKVQGIHMNNSFGPEVLSTVKEQFLFLPATVADSCPEPPSPSAAFLDATTDVLD